MIELAKHIEILLLDNDCVIVPELGGFIAHYQPAHYETDEGLFLPPMRTVGFNPQLTMNDGLLVQSYMQAYHTDYPDAVRIISEKVKILKDKLYEEGVAEMQGIGVLHYTIYETYEFHPNENGVLSPDIYALDAFAISPLGAETVAQGQAEPVKTESVIELPSTEKKEIRMDSHWWRNAVAVIVAAVLFFSLSVPVENTYVDKGVYASLGTDCLFDAIRAQSMATTLFAPEMEVPQLQKKAEVVPVAVKVEKVSPARQPQTKETKVEKAVAKVEKEVVKETPKVKEAVKPAPKKITSSKKYHIIVASVTTDKDAQRMLKNYNQQGYRDVSVIESNGRFRISLCCHTDKTKAYNQLNDLKRNDAFKQAWMLTSK